METEQGTLRWYVVQALVGYENQVVKNLRENIRLHKLESKFGEIGENGLNQAFSFLTSIEAGRNACSSLRPGYRRLQHADLGFVDHVIDHLFQVARLFVNLQLAVSAGTHLQHLVNVLDFLS